MSSGLVKGAGAAVYAEGRPAVVPPMSVAKLVEPLPTPDATCADEPVRHVFSNPRTRKPRTGTGGLLPNGIPGSPREGLTARDPGVQGTLKVTKRPA
jgi:hypothetical protein